MEKYIQKYKYIVSTQYIELPKWRLFEYLVAIEQNMVMWEDVDLKTLAKFGIKDKKDRGIDIINLEFTKTIQVKHSSQGRNISYNALTSFFVYSKKFFNIDDMTLVISDNIKVSEMGKNIISNIIQYDFDLLMGKYCMKLNHSLLDENPKLRGDIFRLYSYDSMNLSNSQIELCCKNHKFVKLLSTRLYPTRVFGNMIYVETLNSWAILFRGEIQKYLICEDELGEIIVIGSQYNGNPKNKTIYANISRKEIIIEQPELGIPTFQIQYEKSLDWIDQNLPVDRETTTDYYNKYDIMNFNPKMNESQLIEYVGKIHRYIYKGKYLVNPKVYKPLF